MSLDPQVVQILLSVKEDTGYMRGQMESQQERIARLEKREETKETRAWIRTAIVVPLVLAFQHGLRTIGIDF